MNPVRIIVASLLVSVISTPASAQFRDRLRNPRLNLSINHPPLLGVKLSRVAPDTVALHEGGGDSEPSDGPPA